MSILIGLPASGKTTFSAKLHMQNFIIISMDIFRSKIIEKKKFKECIAMSQLCVIDNTNITKAERAYYINSAKVAGYSIRGYYFTSTVKEVVARNRQREAVKRVPEVAIFSIAKRLETPSKNEGFDELFSVRPNGKGGVIVESLDT